MKQEAGAEGESRVRIVDSVRVELDAALDEIVKLRLEIKILRREVASLELLAAYRGDE